MSFKTPAKIFVILLLLGLTAWQVIGHPSYLNLYANDPRAKQELKTNCAICHAPEGRAREANFLTEFGREFSLQRYRITDEMRGRFPQLFQPAGQPVTSVTADTVSIGTTQVVVNVTVRSARGKAVGTLDREAFKLMEDDREQEVTEFFGEDTPLAVAVVLDVSGSALEKDLNRYRNAVLDLAYRLRAQDMLAVYTFDQSGVQKISEYASTVRELKPLLKQIQGQGGSPLYDAVLAASRELRARPERRRALILISDGSDTASAASLREVERETFRAGVAVYAIDLINTEKSARRSAERQAAAQTLKQIAQESGGRYITTEGGFFLLTSRMKLKRIFTSLIDELHSQYTLSYEPANARRQGRWRTIRVNLEQADLTGRTRLGYREDIE